jgi:hypothetical protein
MTVVIDGTGSPVQLDQVDADWLLALAEDAEVQIRAAERGRLRLAAQWCVLHEVTDQTADAPAAWWGQAGGAYKGYEDRVGSAGTPMIAEFAVEPFAAALQISPTACLELLSDVLDLQHRLPRCWARVEALEIPAWRARRIAQATRPLTPQAAAWVDDQVAPIAGACGVTRLDRLVAQAAAEFDPVSAAEAESDAHRDHDVRLTQGTATAVGDHASAATSVVDITGDTPTLTRFHDLVTQLAAELLDPDRDGYRAEDLGRRKVTALGILCDRAQAGRGLHQEGSAPAGSGAGRQTRLYLHFTLADLHHPLIKTGTVERLGPLTTHALSEWIDTSRCTILPVLDMRATDAVDRHDPPEWMAELVRLRDHTCVFPWCAKDSRGCDLDHIIEYLEMSRGGPPGQTHPGNLAPLCRRHHRLKTSRRWRYQRNPNGTYTWTSPHRRRYTVTPDGTVTAN